MNLGENALLNEASCAYVVTQFILGQRWRLVDHAEMAARIWAEVRDRGLAGPAAVQTVQQMALQLYARLLHDACRQPAGGQRERAWLELGRWLTRHAARLTDDPAGQDELVQETLASLQNRLATAPLDAPQTLWAYALRSLHNRQVDHHRRQAAAKRRQSKVVRLEDTPAGPDSDDWQEKVAAPSDRQADLEGALVKKEIRLQLRVFLRANLPTTLQQRVAELHFLEGLSPAEIAPLLGKEPHEIRLVKARVVQTLRNLRPELQNRLLRLLEGGNGES
ncbi:MAG: sigma-70 family RNA polymerase sigma factor [Chloroflexota bacterium]